VPQRWAVTCKLCQGTAFVVLGDLPSPTDVVTAARCEHLDGRPLTGTDALECDSCGKDYTRVGVAPSGQWTLLPETFQLPHSEDDTPFGSYADPRDIALVRLTIQALQRPRARRRRPTRAVG
jgi:hypothetical protein